MRKTIVILCVLLLSLVQNGCIGEKNDKVKSIEGVFSVKEEKFDYDMLYTYIDMSRSELINQLGENFAETQTGPEGSLDGLLYKELGLEFALDEDKVLVIYCSDKVDFNGARAGMNFEQIQEKLGKAKIEETWYEIPENTAFFVEYIIDNNELTFVSFNEDGSDSMLWVSKVYKK